MDGISKKIYLELQAPTEDDNRSDQRRIQDGLKEQGIEAKVSLRVLRKLYPLCEEAEWKVTVSLAWDGQTWHGVDLEAGDTTGLHYGVAVDLGSTTVVARLVDCATGKILGETSTFNGQIPYGTDILTRIFHCQEDRGTLEILRKAAVTSITTCVRELEAQQQLPENSCIAMAIGGNTTMIHFLLGMDAFCVFHTPYAVHADQPGFLPAKDLELPVKGYVYIYPAKSNYLGGDIISGMVATGIYKKEKINAFFDIGTNGELVLGNRDFLLCGAGAFGKHVSKESAIAIGMYPDMERDRIIHAGNSSLEGAVCALLDCGVAKEVEEILEKMVYIQFAAVEDFLNTMVAAQALPHTDLERYPTVKEKLERLREEERVADVQKQK